MSFKFNFFASEDSTLSDNNKANKDVNNATSAQAAKREVKVIPYNPQSESLLFMQWKLFNIMGEKYFYLKNTVMTINGITEDAVKADLVPDVYEGGFEVWECTVDLLNYLHSLSDIFMGTAMSILDLGCGSGLLGICAKRKCLKSTVHFQDYNHEVIENFTIKNYHKNCGDQEPHDVHFFAGDWDDVSVKLTKYDLILSAETIYNVNSQEKVLKILLNHLTDNGVAYIASKRHYFGVGGGVVDFMNLVVASGLLKCEVAWSNVTGLFRDILKVHRCVGSESN